jgi:hypothetical protein
MVVAEEVSAVVAMVEQSPWGLSSKKQDVGVWMGKRVEQKWN